MENYEQARKEAMKKHNKRVQSIRNVRLSKADVKCIDDVIKNGQTIRESLIESVAWGGNCLSMEDVVSFSDALLRFEAQFTERK